MGMMLVLENWYMKYENVLKLYLLYGDVCMEMSMEVIIIGI